MANILDPMDLKQILTLHIDGLSNRRIAVHFGYFTQYRKYLYQTVLCQWLPFHVSSGVGQCRFSWIIFFQKPHAEQWTLFPDNISEHLSIDETSFSNGELYTIVSSKSAKGRKGTILATIRGTKAEDIIAVLERIPLKLRNKVREVTMDMAPNMAKAIRRCFRNARRVVDRFHVQKLAYDAVQELRIKYRWEVLDAESKKIMESRKRGIPYDPELLPNGDTLKQLLARSRHLLFKHPSRWSESQKRRAELLFIKFPKLKQAYDLGVALGDIFNKCRDKKVAFTKLALWHNPSEIPRQKIFRP